MVTRRVSIATRLCTLVSVALEVATKELGYEELRPNQEAAIRNFLGGKDLFVSLSTGAGNPLLLFASESVR